jgi:hypothetical protein
LQVYVCDEADNLKVEVKVWQTRWTTVDISRGSTAALLQQQKQHTTETALALMLGHEW